MTITDLQDYVDYLWIKKKTTYFLSWINLFNPHILIRAQFIELFFKELELEGYTRKTIINMIDEWEE